MLTIGALTMLLVAGAPAVPAASVTERVETSVDDPAIPGDVLESVVRLRHPLPQAQKAPEACDWISYLRWRHKDGPADSADADAVLTDMPGLSGGAGEQTQIGSRIVHLAAQRGKKVEFWALDRRSNCLENHTGIDAANQAGDARVAADYYWNGKAVGGRTFPGWHADKDLHLVAELGIARTLDDWRAVIQQGLPDPAEHTKVLCGGHSLGGLITGVMATWDFDRNPATIEDAGHHLCGGGYFALDTVVDTDLLGLQAVPFLDLVPKLLGGTLETASKVIRTGPLRTFSLSTSPEGATFTDTVGIGARFQGRQESDLLRRIPRTPTLDLALRMGGSRDLGAFLTGKPGPRDYRYTGEALLGSLVDNNIQPLSLGQLSVGTLDSAEVAPKSFPLPGQLAGIPVLGEALNNFVSVGKTFAPTNTRTLYGWRNYDRVGAPDAPRQLDVSGRPAISPDTELTDIRTVATQFSAPSSLDGNEWYFPIRLLSDIAFAMVGTRSGDLGHMLHERGVKAHPTATLIAGNGPVQYAALVGRIPKDAIRLPGYRHCDVIGAALKQNGGKLNPASTAMTDFTLRRIAAR